MPGEAPLTPGSSSRRRALIDIWRRGAIILAIILSIPLIFPRLMRALDPGLERREMAQALERQRGLVWWSRVLAAVFTAGLLRRTVRVLRCERSAPAP